MTPQEESWLPCYWRYAPDSPSLPNLLLALINNPDFRISAITPEPPTRAHKPPPPPPTCTISDAD